MPEKMDWETLKNCLTNTGSLGAAFREAVETRMRQKERVHIGDVSHACTIGMGRKYGQLVHAMLWEIAPRTGIKILDEVRDNA